MKSSHEMNLDRAVMVFAGCVILLSVILTLVHSHWWLILTTLAGINLIQSPFTGFCPPVFVFRKLGLREGCAFEGRKQDA